MGVRFDLVVFAAACAAAVGARAACPPEGFDSVSGFNLTEYIAAPWYIQEQQVNRWRPSTLASPGVVAHAHAAGAQSRACPRAAATSPKTRCSA